MQILSATTRSSALFNLHWNHYCTLQAQVPGLSCLVALLGSKKLSKLLLGIRSSTANEVVPPAAELGRYPLQIRFWQQILQYHQRTLGLEGTRLVTLVMLEGISFDGGAIWVEGGLMPEWHEQQYDKHHSTNSKLKYICTELYSLVNMWACQLSGVSQAEGC